MLLDDNGQASERAADVINRRGPDPNKPRVDGARPLLLVLRRFNLAAAVFSKAGSCECFSILLGLVGPLIDQLILRGWMDFTRFRRFWQCFDQGSW